MRCSITLWILPAVLALSAAPTVAQVSSWWYPLGPMEGTRYQAARTNDTARLPIKWKTAALRSSESLLIGAFRPESGNRQQVLGQHSNEVRILRSNGQLDTARFYSGLFGPDYRLVLTGLFNVDAPSPVAEGRPNALGLGVERRQDVAGNRLFAALADPRLEPFQLLRIGQLEQDPNPDNMAAGLYPVAAYRPRPADSPIVALIVSQDQYTAPARDTMVNGVRQYALDRRTLDLTRRWSYPQAPRAYVQAPGLAFDISDRALILTPSVGTYPFSPPAVVSHTDPRRLQTRSDMTYAITLRVDEPAEDVIETQAIPPIGVVPGEVHTYYVRLSRTDSDPERLYQLVTENHDPTMPGQPRLYLRNFRLATTTQLGLYEDPTTRDHGWSIVQADLDGADQSFPRRAGLVPNRGLEIVAARRRLDGSPMDTNRLYLLRFNERELIRQVAFGVFADQAFRGQILAAGDLVRDSLGKDEIVVADRNVLRILRFRRFADEAMRGDNPSFFETLESYTLDTRILRAAIADLEDDGANDLVVVTESSTYAFGRPIARPFGDVTVSAVEVCAGESFELRWRRSVGGGDAGLAILAVNASSGTVDTLVSGYQPESSEQYLIDGSRLSPGQYRLRIVDRDVPGIVDSSTVVTVAPVSIDAPTVSPAPAGTRASLSAAVACADTVQLEVSFDGTNWQNLASPVAVVSGEARSEYRVPCPPAASCIDTLPIAVWYRLSTPDGAWHSAPAASSVLVTGPTLSVTNVGTTPSRQRVLRWNRSEFDCESVSASVSFDDGAVWQPLGDFPAIDDSATVDIPGELEQDVRIRLCCSSGCGAALARTTVAEIGDANFIAPNPFSPSDTPENSATIIYRLTREGSVTITVFDASRAVVRTIVEGEPQRTGLHRSSWDGRSADGAVVADGAYICVISSSSGERLVLPVSIAKR